MSAGNNSGNSNSGGGQGGANNRKRRSKNRKSRAKQNRAFWGDADKLPDPPERVRITTDSYAMVRSLGTPPLPGHERIAEHYFTAVTDRAVMLASALAAAGGLVETEELTE